MSSEIPGQPEEISGGAATQKGEPSGELTASKFARRIFLIASGLGLAGTAALIVTAPPEGKIEAGPSLSDRYIVSERRNQRISRIAAEFGRRIITYAQMWQDDPERSHLFDEDESSPSRSQKNGTLTHGFMAMHDGGNMFTLNVNVIQNADGTFRYDEVDPYVSVLREGPVGSNGPKREVQYSTFKGLPDYAKGSWSVINTFARSYTSEPMAEISDFMLANEMSPPELLRVERKAFHMCDQLLYSAGVPE